MYRWSCWYVTGLSGHESSSVPTPDAAIFEPCTALPVIYQRTYWKRLYQPTSSQPWSYPTHWRKTWIHNMGGRTTTLGSQKPYADNLEGQRCIFIYVENKIEQTKETFLTAMFLIPRATTSTTFSQVLSSMYAALFEITQDISGNQYLVTKFLPLRLWCNFVPFSRNITGLFASSAIPNRRAAIKNLESLQFFSWQGLSLPPIILNSP